MRLEGESMRSRASAASKVLSEQWTPVPWTEASTETHKFKKNKITGWAQWRLLYQNTVTLLIPAGKMCPAQGHSNIIPSCFPISKLRSHNLLIYMVNLIISQTNHNKYYQLQVTSINTVLHVLNTKCYYMAPPSGETNCFETIGRHIHSDPDTLCVRNVDIILPLYIC